MKALQLKKMLVGLAGLALLSGAAHALETETGQIKLTTFATGLFENDGLYVRMVSPTGSATCGNSGAMVMLLDGEASKATYSALLAAVSGGKSVTVSYAAPEEPGGECLLAAVDIQ